MGSSKSAALRLRRRYSERLGVLSAEQLQAALARFDLGRLIAAAPAAQGLFGQILFLTASSGEWVFRGAPHDGQLQRERFVSRLIHERTELEAPWPYYIEPSPEIFGWPYGLMHRIAGEVEGADGEDDQIGLALALGEGLVELHAIEVEAPGYYDPVEDRLLPYPVDHETRVVGMVHEWLGRCLEARREATPKEDIAWLEAIVEARRSALSIPFTPRFVHHDYKPNNVLCERIRSGWRVNGVVDLGEGYFGDPEEDLVRSIATFARTHPRSVQPFLRAYAERRALRPGHAERYPIYQLIDHLVFWEYGQRNRLWFPPALRFRAFAEPFVTQLQPYS